MSIKFTRYTAESNLSDAESKLRDGEGSPDLQYRIDSVRSDIQSLDISDASDEDYSGVLEESKDILNTI